MDGEVSFQGRTNELSFMQVHGIEAMMVIDQIDTILLD